MIEHIQPAERQVSLEAITVQGEPFYRITHVNALRPFFMSIVSDSNHWMFISSNGGLSAGRKNAEYALFPYYTDDKIAESADMTGSKSIFQVHRNGEMRVWEPFSDRSEGRFETRQNLYKCQFGNKILFEEVNLDLGLVFQYQWNFSNEFGLVKKAGLVNISDQPILVNLLDGIQNIVPHGVGSELQMRAGNLVDAYKRSELEPDSGLGIFALSAIIVDKAEPSEALKANVAFSIGLENPTRLLSSTQLNAFRQGGAVQPETDVKGEKGAYFVCQTVELTPNAEKEWMIVANVNQSHAAVVQLVETIQADDRLGERIQQDIDLGAENLIMLVAAADGVQCTNDALNDSRHFSNVLFNIMRGGIFDNNYQIERADFFSYLKQANPSVFSHNGDVLERLPVQFSLSELKNRLAGASDPDLVRLATEYLPLKFSRRHGDPSRPWNMFSINTRSEVDGSKILDYQGNWRDIFQNWEALAHAYPAFIEGMLFKFLNASTFDGYNPYRVTKGGFDWETIERDDPWSYIGYWGDHQIIYLLKFLEFAEQYYPDLLNGLLDAPCFVYANVPYKIKSYPEIGQNPKDTIDFDFDLDDAIRALKREIGADGALLRDKQGKIIHVNFIEKILATVLAKLSNLVLEGGIWMNTQRPEWNDANNALVGNGVSMVTLYYLRRFMPFFRELVSQSALEELPVSSELAVFFQKIQDILAQNLPLLNGKIGDRERRNMLDQLGAAAGDYRSQIYTHSFSGEKHALARTDLARFATHTLAYLEHAIQANQRPDHLYHGYNLMTYHQGEATISHLYEMLEGQVAVLSSGRLSADESLQVLDALRQSAMYREDQNSYMLYPNKALPGFLQKNTLSGERIAQSDVLKNRMHSGFSNILEKDLRGNYHFNGDFKNAADLAAALEGETPFDAAEKAELLALFEEAFNHKAFTGRSGTFFGYEGLGSIYWHMVSKLRLAVQEVVMQAIEANENRACVDRLMEHYYAIAEGIGVHKSPEVYGAFPTDPYSHTPLGRGARQPGMTGQVKEDILCRLGELGVSVRGGELHFRPLMLRKQEFLAAPKQVVYFDVDGQKQEMAIPENALFFTYCSAPVVYALAEEERLELHFADGTVEQRAGLGLNKAASQKIWNRSGHIRQINVWVNPQRLQHL